MVSRLEPAIALHSQIILLPLLRLDIDPQPAEPSHHHVGPLSLTLRLS